MYNYCKHSEAFVVYSQTISSKKRRTGRGNVEECRSAGQGWEKVEWRKSKETKQEKKRRNGMTQRGEEKPVGELSK